MSDRQALRDLQARLATRLQDARTGVSVAWLAVKAANRHFLLPLAQSGEIVPYTQPQGVPYAQAWFCGVTNIRGRLYGVVDFAAFIGESSTQAAIGSEASVVTLNGALDLNSALRVDSLEGLRGADDFVSSTPTQQEHMPYMGSIFVDKSGVSWQEVNLRALAQTPEFLNISASY
ncbi:chemotaxis protein CheW [Curvibacter sp. CHRR-16]|uniref:chemotaxis protein CheW n=1 Tax=Curvibacter sp. CHRR-16 TaxID=2835872 RepID=UPI001BDB17FE|nr:chemotaxis protein CheW [Curvibacter sp. CHRR-16]MBT0569871.1 chemotaxis protein CheW [Curvibacter sp. CHRR-16]